MSTVRQRRLANEYAELEHYSRQHPRVRLTQVVGDPPERYEVELRVASIQLEQGEVVPARDHRVEIQVSRNFPRSPPTFRLLTAAFHPNIQGETVQFEEHWNDSMSLTQLVIRLSEMLAFQRYQLGNAINPAAVTWIQQHIDQLPLDERNMHQPASESCDPVDAVATPQAETTPSLNVPEIPVNEESLKLTCPACGAVYHVRKTAAGKRVQCRKCRQTFRIQQ